jgi:hypothetical protein
MHEEEPRLFIMHFGANDDAAGPDRKSRAAQDKTNLAKSSSSPLIAPLTEETTKGLNECSPFSENYGHQGVFRFAKLL